MDGRKN